MPSFEETGRGGNTSGTGIGTGTGGPDGMEGQKEGATKNGIEGMKSEAEAMKSGTGDTRNMAGVEDIGK